METKEERNLERRLRRKFRKYNLMLKKSRVRTPNINNQGGYMIVELYRNECVAGSKFDLTLEEVKDFVVEED